MFAKLIAIALLVAVTLGCCWAEDPGSPIASDELMEAYRQTALWYKCGHKPYHCISADYHSQRLVLDERCHDDPPHTQIKDCLKKHIEIIYELGCYHTTPKCTDALGHYNTIRGEQGLKPISLK